MFEHSHSAKKIPDSYFYFVTTILHTILISVLFDLFIDLLSFQKTKIYKKLISSWPVGVYLLITIFYVVWFVCVCVDNLWI